jgi:hypothetical protein
MKKTIFISSTFQDLRGHRKAIWQLLEEYDVHILGMERFGARKEAPIDTCLSSVERSDIYVGLIAHRLGSVHQDIGKSFTQLEYEKAVDLEKEILIYLIDEKEALISYRDIEFGESHEKLQNFKRLLQEKHTIDFFRNPDDLTQKLKHRLDDLLTRKNKEVYSEDYSYSKNILEKFHLFPKKYNDIEIKLKLKVNKDGFPASKNICDIFNLDFGETLGVSCEIVEPKINENKLKYLFIYEDFSDFYLNNTGSEPVEILGRLVFSEHRVANQKANFFDEIHTTRELNPSFDPSKPSFPDSLYGRFPNIFENQKYITKETTIEGDCTAIIIFIKNLNPII